MSSRIYAPDVPKGSTIDIKVRQGVWISKGQLVAIIKKPKSDETPTSQIIKVKAELAGKVIEIKKKNGDPIQTG